MATIIPFSGTRYNENTAGKLSALIAPPYDVINQEEQKELYNNNPYNVIRLEYGETYDKDNDNVNQYARAAGFFNEWKKRGILINDDQPALYFYQQEFEVAGMKLTRSGFFAGVKLEPYEKKVVVPHEETIPKHKKDRLELMQNCKANFSPVFGLFADKEKLVDNLLFSASSSKKPDVEFIEGDQVHRMWLITDSGVIEQVQGCMQQRQVFIADGHHRYETALNYRDERRQEEPGAEPGTRPYDYVMMTLVNLYDPGLIILPTHRLVKSVSQIDKFLDLLEEDFNIEQLDLQKYYAAPHLLEDTLMSRANMTYKSSVKDAFVFALYTGKDLFLLTLKSKDVLRSKMPGDKSMYWNELDVSVLHELVLQRHLGIGARERASGDYLNYTRDASEVFREVDSGSCDIGVFMNPTMTSEVLQVAGQGERMPQKSTFFYPKLITGLLINDIST
ncbi:MAG: DUF1015 domain-containing protein [Clostridiales bacterium]|nr:DUF1015 domain-containing protein [Clostridiales bacterium]MCF8023320.1 DUF1015 domain-containing protein [Clostridiales bacterium]